MKESITRREFILALGAGSLSHAWLNQFLIASTGQDAKLPQLFLHASAVDDVIGLLLATEIGRHQAHIERLRKRHRFYGTLKYGSTNKYKVPFALDLLDYFFKDTDLTFIARVQENAFGTDHGMQAKTNWVKVVGQQLHELINAGVKYRPVSQKSVAHRYLDINSPGGNDRKNLAAYLVQNTDGMVYMQNRILNAFPGRTWRLDGRRHSVDNLSQLAGFLTRAAGSLTLPPTPKFPPLTNHGKVKLRRWLVERLGGENGISRSLEGHPKFRVLLRGAA